MLRNTPKACIQDICFLDSGSRRDSFFGLKLTAKGRFLFELVSTSYSKWLSFGDIHKN